MSCLPCLGYWGSEPIGIGTHWDQDPLGSGPIVELDADVAGLSIERGLCVVYIRQEPFLCLSIQSSLLGGSVRPSHFANYFGYM